MDRNQLVETLRSQLSSTLSATDYSGLGDKYEGKVRDNYTQEGRRTIIVSDRVSTFDVVVGTIPYKGQVLNQLAHYWFQQTADIAPNHVVSVPDPNVMIVDECEPLQCEFVMRAYLTGVSSTAILRAYNQGAREFCGHHLPDGLRPHQRLPEPLLTPSTKAAKGDHDVSVSRAELLGTGAISAHDFDSGAKIAKALFAFGQQRAAERGMILVDTKYEMGKRADGTIVVIDEIHTPDSSRYWYAQGYDDRMAAGEPPKNLDKEFLRRWLVDEHGYRGDGPPPPLTDEVRIEAALRYIDIYELITGQAFVPDTSAPLDRIARNLGL